MTIIDPNQQPELRIQQIQDLEDEILRKDLACQAAEKEILSARQRLLLLQGNAASQLQVPSSPSTSASNIDVPSPVYDEFQLSGTSHAAGLEGHDAALSRRRSIPRSAGHAHGTPSSHHSLPSTPQSCVSTHPRTGVPIRKKLTSPTDSPVPGPAAAEDHVPAGALAVPDDPLALQPVDAVSQPLHV